jgi:hypothetical protein
MIALLGLRPGNADRKTSEKHEVPYHFYDVDLLIDDVSIRSLGAKPRVAVPATLLIKGCGQYAISLHLKGNASFQRIGQKPNFTAKVQTVPSDLSGTIFAGKFYLHNSSLVSGY